MKAFKIDRRTWHYRLNKQFLNEDGWHARSMELNWEPKHNNFCSYWRATILRVVALVICLAVAGFILIGLGVLVYEHPFETLKTLGLIVAVLALIAGLIWTSETLKNRQQKDAPPGLLAQRYRAYKSQICPQVEYE